MVAVAQLAAFLFLRRTQRHLYAPRTVLATLDEVERTPPLHKNGWFNWIPAFWRLKDHELLEKQSLDAYLFLRFLKMIILICFVGLCMTWPILFPVNINGGGKAKELDRLTIGNVKNPNKYYVHLFISWVFLGKHDLIFVPQLSAHIFQGLSCSLSRERRFTTSIYDKHTC